MEVCRYDKDETVEGADIVLATAGAPRTPEMKDRTDLTKKNAIIIEQIAKAVTVGFAIDLKRKINKKEQTPYLPVVQT